MPDIKFILGSLTSATFSMSGIIGGKSSSDIIFGIYPVANHSLAYGEQIKALVIPSSYGMSSADASGYLVDPYSKNDSSIGLYFMSPYKNEVEGASLPANVSFRQIQFSKDFENTEFDLFWLQSVGQGATLTQQFGSGTNVYSFPHNIQYDEVVLSGKLVDRSTIPYIDYVLKFDPIVNEGAAYSDGPYMFKLKYALDWRNEYTISGYNESGSIVAWDPDVSNGYRTYASGYAASGISVSLPFYYPNSYPRAKIPAVYNAYIMNNSAGTDKPGSLPFLFQLDHGSLGASLGIRNILKGKINTYVKANNISKIGEILIRNGEGQNKIIDRKRVSLGISDIAIVSNKYKSTGVYISPYYNTDFDIYTFSLKVREYIPNYEDLVAYDIIKYFVEFNNTAWEPISPTTRDVEHGPDGSLLPKLIVFDKSAADITNDNLKFINIANNVRTFRIKIIFDLLSLDTSQFAPPEVRDYRAIIFDKNQFLDI